MPDGTSDVILPACKRYGKAPAMKRPYRIVIADDHAYFRQDLEKMLTEKREFSVIGQAYDGLDLLDFLKTEVPDMVILDISMPRLNGLNTAGEIKIKYPGVAILMLTMHKDEEYITRALSAGADGYLLKEEVDRELFIALDCIRSGRIYLSPSCPSSRRGN
ncbi:MAG: response regulator transcription factor [Nitrospirota bacterium]